MRAAALLLVVSAIMPCSRALRAADVAATDRFGAAMKSHLANWEGELKFRLREGQHIDEVNKVLMPRAQRSAKYVLGGTGAFIAIYQIDDFIEISVSADGQGIISDTIGIYRNRKRWMLDPLGYFVTPPHDAADLLATVKIPKPPR
jgi:hypothetical protein